MREMLLTTGIGGERSASAQRSRNLVPHLVLLEVALGQSFTAVETLDRGRAVGLRAALQLDDIWLANLADTIRTPIERVRKEFENVRAGSSPLVPGRFPALFASGRRKLRRRRLN